MDETYKAYHRHVTIAIAAMAMFEARLHAKEERKRQLERNSRIKCNPEVRS